MTRTARSVEDVVLGEATSGTRAQRFEDMLGIVSSIANRAAATGVSMQDIVSAKGQYSAYGRSLPKGVEEFRELARQAIEHVQRYGPTTPAQYYATPSAVKNLPSGLQAVAKSRGHAYFVDPQARAINTAVGYRKPGQTVYDIMPEEEVTAAPRDDVLDAVFGFGAAAAASGATPAASARAADLDAVFGLETSPAAASRDDVLDSVFGLSSPADVATDLESGPTDQWDGSFSNPVGITDRTTSAFGSRTAPQGSLGIGSANHRGVDLSAAPGELGYAAESVAPGVVSFAGPSGRYGNLVTVDHPNGYTSSYGHLQDINVSVGDEIARGSPIGTVGETGNVSGPHLHLEVRDQFGKTVNPAGVVDFSRRDTVTPSSRPMSPTEQRNAASAYGNMAASLSEAGMLGVGGKSATSGLPSGFDLSRFAGSINPTGFGSLATPVSPSAGFATATDFGTPAAERFGRTAEVNPERFGRTAAEIASAAAQGPLSPSSFAAAEVPGAAVGKLSADIDPSRFGPRDQISANIDPDRFGPAAGTAAHAFGSLTGSPSATAAMTSTPTTGRLASQVNPANSTPMAAMRPDLSIGLIGEDLAPARGVSTVSVVPSSMTALPAPDMPPQSFSTFNAMPTNQPAALGLPPSSITNLAVSPLTLAPVAPPATAMLPARVATPLPSRSPPTPAPRPSFSALDVWSGRSPVGYQANATGDNLVSRDRFGNVSVTNRYGATTVTDPSGRQVASWGSFDPETDTDDDGIGGRRPGSLFDRFGSAVGARAPGVIGSLVGSAIAGPAGGIVGAMLGNKLGGQQTGRAGARRSGGFLAGLFGGGASRGGRGGGGSSGGGGRGGRGGGGGGFSPAGADRDNAGN